MRGMVVNEIDEVLGADDNSEDQCDSEGNRWLVKKMWHMYTAEHIYSTIKRNKVVSFAEMWIDLEPVIQSEVRKRKTTIIY